jgi:PAS domain S-box-containing protein
MKTDQIFLDFEKMVKNSLDVLGSIDREGNIQFVSNACTRIIGYDSRELTGRKFTDFIHPDDLLLTSHAIQEVLEGGRKVSFENRYIHKDGHEIPIQWTGVWSEGDEIIYCVGRDTTEQKTSQLQLETSEQRYRALFDNSPDPVFVEDVNGYITEVNQQLRETLGISTEQVKGLPASSFLPDKIAAINTINFEQALLGNHMRFDIRCTKDGKARIYDTTKHPVMVNNKVVGVQTIARDITPMVRSHQLIEQQARKLNTIFESITDAFFTLDRDWNFTYINGEAEKLLSLDREYHIGKNAWKEFPSELDGEFYRQYHLAVGTGNAVHFEAYYAGTNRWVEVKAYPSMEGLSVYFNDVTERVKARQELEMLSIVASKTVNSILIMDKDRRIEWVNESFTKLTGYTFPEVAGKIPYRILPGEETDQATVERMIEKANQAQPYSGEILVYKKSCEKRWFKVETTPVFDEAGNLVRFIGVQTDITERVEARKELEKLSLVASRTNNSVLIADSDWRIEWVNDGFTRLFEYSPEEVVGRRPSELLHSPKTDKSTYALLEEKLVGGESISFDVLNVKKSGEEVWLNVDITPIFDENRKLSRFIEVQTDITALKTSELELTRSAKDLYSHNKDLEQFTYIVSHNLRAPVANALGLANLLKRIDKNTDLYDQSLTNLTESVVRLDMVMRDMSTILSVRDSRATLEQEQVDINLVLQQTLSSLKEPLAGCGGEVITDLKEGQAVKANRAYLYSVFYNLLSNAIKYRSDERTLQVSIKCLRRSDSGTLLSFSDNGSGFDMEKAGANIFKLYKRFHTHKKGRGIGLYLVRSHVEAMGGRIKVTSEVGTGTRFLIYLLNK